MLDKVADNSIFIKRVINDDETWVCEYRRSLKVIPTTAYNIKNLNLGMTVEIKKF